MKKERKTNKDFDENRDALREAIKVNKPDETVTKLRKRYHDSIVVSVSSGKENRNQVCETARMGL